MTGFGFPDLDERVAVLGHTGSGKTVGGLFLLSEAGFDKQPFIIFDLKEETLFRKIPKLKWLDWNAREMPDGEGLYIVSLLPNERNYPVINDYLERIWRAGSTGVFVDEGHHMPNSDELKALFITGRSRRIPVIAASQRPVLVPRHMISEADYHMNYHLHDKRDRDIVRAFTPDPNNEPIWDTSKKLPRYHWRWYDSKRDRSFISRPVPYPDQILKRINTRLEPFKRFI